MLDLREVTAEDAIDAMMTVEGLRVQAASLRSGDRVVYHENGVYTVATVESVTGRLWVTVVTDVDTWSCSAENRRCLRVSR